MNKQTKVIFLGLGLVTIAVSVYGFIRGEGLDSFWGVFIGLSLIVLALYKQKPENPQDKT